MSSLVVDASALIDALLGVPEVAARLAIAIETSELHAPHLIDVEIVHAVRRAVLRGELTIEEANRRIELFLMLPIIRHSHLPYLSRSWGLRDNVTACDAAYVALAEALDVPLWTRDARLARSSGHAARIEYIA